MVQQGLMMPAGLDKINAAKQDGSWTTMDEIEALVLPPDPRQALEASPTAQQNFEAFSRSAKKNILVWISSAKRPETRLKRIEQTVSSAAHKKNPLSR
jgi:uncharacterized protein YdeI (YjbR/CyaY-like superfamily)